MTYVILVQHIFDVNLDNSPNFLDQLIIGVIYEWYQ